MQAQAIGTERLSSLKATAGPAFRAEQMRLEAHLRGLQAAAEEAKNRQARLEKADKNAREAKQRSQEAAAKRSEDLVAKEVSDDKMFLDAVHIR